MVTLRYRLAQKNIHVRRQKTKEDKNTVNNQNIINKQYKSDRAKLRVHCKSYRYRKGLQKGTQSNRYVIFPLEVPKRASSYNKGTQKVHFRTFLFYLIFNSENWPEKGTLFFLRYQKVAKKVPKERYMNYEKGTKFNKVVEVLIRYMKGTGTGDQWM